MLNRDGERVLEVLLVAAALALAAIVHDDLPGRNPSGSHESTDSGSAYTRQILDIDRDQSVRLRTTLDAPVSAGPIRQALAELERLTSRC